MVKLVLLLFLPLLLCMIGVGVSYYVAFFDIKVVLQSLKKSEVVPLFFRDFGNSKSTFGNLLSGVVIFPRRHIAEGTLIPEELAKIPRAVVFRMKFGFWLMASSMMWILAGCIYMSMR